MKNFWSVWIDLKEFISIPVNWNGRENNFGKMCFARHSLYNLIRDRRLEIEFPFIFNYNKILLLLEKITWSNFDLPDIRMTHFLTWWTNWSWWFIIFGRFHHRINNNKLLTIIITINNNFEAVRWQDQLQITTTAWTISNKWMMIFRKIAAYLYDRKRPSVR